MPHTSGQSAKVKHKSLLHQAEGATRVRGTSRQPAADVLRGTTSSWAAAACPIPACWEPHWPHALPEVITRWLKRTISLRGTATQKLPAFQQPNQVMPTAKAQASSRPMHCGWWQGARHYLLPYVARVHMYQQHDGPTPPNATVQATWVAQVRKLTQPATLLRTAVHTACHAGRRPGLVPIAYHSASSTPGRATSWFPMLACSVTSSAAPGVPLVAAHAISSCWAS